MSGRRLPLVVFLLCCFVIPVWCQSPDTTPQDAFSQRVPAIQLTDQSVVDGVAQLALITNLAVSVELPLGSTISAPAPPVVRLTGTVGPDTLARALDALCSLDQTFTWLGVGNTIHIFPRARGNDSAYLLNRKIDLLTLRNVPGASEAALSAVAQLTGPKEQIAVLQIGPSVSFVHPWTASFKDITVREALDKIAQQLGATYGWQFSGAADFRVITFHEWLGVEDKKVKRTSDH